MNKKKVIIVSIAVVAIIAVICLIAYFCNKSIKKTYTKLTSIDGKFSINMPDNIKYKMNSIPENDFTIDLYSEEDGMFMYSTTISKAREFDLHEVANDDKTAYFKDKENIREDTGITETKINGNKAYEYSLIYFDKQYNKDFYCHVVWIETENNIYILNFEVTNENSEKYKDEFINIQNSFIEL